MGANRLGRSSKLARSSSLDFASSTGERKTISVSVVTWASSSTSSRRIRPNAKMWFKGKRRLRLSVQISFQFWPSLSLATSRSLENVDSLIRWLRVAEDEEEVGDRFSIYPLRLRYCSSLARISLTSSCDSYISYCRFRTAKSFVLMEIDRDKGNEFPLQSRFPRHFGPRDYWGDSWNGREA